MKIVFLTCLISFSVFNSLAQQNDALIAKNIQVKEDEVPKDAPLSGKNRYKTYNLKLKKDEVLFVKHEPKSSLTMQVASKQKKVLKNKTYSQDEAGYAYYNLPKVDDSISIFILDLTWENKYNIKTDMLPASLFRYNSNADLGSKVLSLASSARFLFANYFIANNKRIVDTTVATGILSNNEATINNGSFIQYYDRDVPKQKALSTVASISKALGEGLSKNKNLRYKKAAIGDGLEDGWLWKETYSLPVTDGSTVYSYARRGPLTDYYTITLEAVESDGGLYTVYLRIQ